MRQRSEWKVPSSCFAKNTFNPIRNVIESLKITPNPDKPMIALSIGDPTVFGNLKPCGEIKEAVISAIRSDKANGYAPSVGYVESREAVANYLSTDNVKLKAEDVILCSGCSCALDICIKVLCSPGQNILVSKPGFPLYETLAVGLGATVKYYYLLPEKNWEIDLESLEDAIDENTAALFITNPSNPCGSVFSKRHLEDILEICKRNKLPIVADEIYHNFVFSDQKSYCIATLTDDVPVLSCGGLTKRFLVPGWRLGWIIINDRNDAFAKEIRQGLHTLSQRILGPNTIVQAALKEILTKTPQIFFEDTLEAVEDCAKLCYEQLKNTPGLHPIMPQGAMYMMVRISMDNFPDFKDDLEMIERLISEQSVFCLPGKCFHVANYFRVVLTIPLEQMKIACQRIYEFCANHYRAGLPLTEGTKTNGISINGDQAVNGGAPTWEEVKEDDIIPVEINKEDIARMKEQAILLEQKICRSIEQEVE